MLKRIHVLHTGGHYLSQLLPSSAEVEDIRFSVTIITSITQHILINNLRKLKSWQHVSATKSHRQAKIERSFGTFNFCAVHKH